MPGDQPFKWSWDQPIELLCLEIGVDAWPRILASAADDDPVPDGPTTPVHVDDPAFRFAVADPLVEQIMLALRDEMPLAARTPSSVVASSLADSLQTALVAHLAHPEGAVFKNRGGDGVFKGGLVDWRLQRVIDHIEKHLAEDIPLSRLAALAGLSEHHFAAAFRQTIGGPPYRYVIKRRIAQAQLMLRSDRTVSVITVARALGFTTGTHFATVFRKITGMTPTAYRDGA